MKVVELVSSAQESDYPIKPFKELNIFSEYFLVEKGNDHHIHLLRYIENIKEWYHISLDSYFTHKLELNIKELCESYYVYCIPEFTGGCDGAYLNNRESNKARKELLEFLIDKYWKD